MRPTFLHLCCSSRIIFLLAYCNFLVNAEPGSPVSSPEYSSFHLVQRADNVTQAISQAEGNCGPIPCLTFDVNDQYVSTTGKHAFQAPSSTDQRGPCPALNAAANHGYLPRSGIAHIADTIQGLSEMYGLSEEFSGFLAAYIVAISGDPLTLRWSLNGPLPDMPIVGSRGRGISNTHNKFECDTSLTRRDWYVGHGDAASVDIQRFKKAYKILHPDNRLTMDKLRQYALDVQQDSILTNPYYFSGVVGAFIAVAGPAFIINMMSNHSLDEPSGYMDGSMFSNFFSIAGEDLDFAWVPGQERIPTNWYKRPTKNKYTLVAFQQDVRIGWSAYPNTFKLGGNINGVNSYRGVDVTTLTGGQYDFQGLLEGNNLQCLLFQAMQQGMLDSLRGLESIAMGLVDQYVTPVLKSQGCPQLGDLDMNAFEDFPGSHI